MSKIKFHPWGQSIVYNVFEQKDNRGRGDNTGEFLMWLIFACCGRWWEKISFMFSQPKIVLGFGGILLLFCCCGLFVWVFFFPGVDSGSRQELNFPLINCHYLPWILQQTDLLDHLFCFKSMYPSVWTYAYIFLQMCIHMPTCTNAFLGQMKLP